MNIYIVHGDNGMTYEDYSHWVECVFSSRESAEKYIEERSERERFIFTRIRELEEIMNNRRLTEEEDAELEKLYVEDCDLPATMWIEEHELKD